MTSRIAVFAALVSLVSVANSVHITRKAAQIHQEFKGHPELEVADGTHKKTQGAEEVREGLSSLLANLDSARSKIASSLSSLDSKDGETAVAGEAADTAAVASKVMSEAAVKAQKLSAMVEHGTDVAETGAFQVHDAASQKSKSEKWETYAERDEALRPKQWDPKPKVNLRDRLISVKSGEPVYLESEVEPGMFITHKKRGELGDKNTWKEMKHWHGGELYLARGKSPEAVFKLTCPAWADRDDEEYVGIKSSSRCAWHNFLGDRVNLDFSYMWPHPTITEERLSERKLTQHLNDGPAAPFHWPVKKVVEPVETKMTTKGKGKATLLKAVPTKDPRTPAQIMQAKQLEDNQKREQFRQDTLQSHRKLISDEEEQPDMFIQFAHDIPLNDKNYRGRPTYQGGYGQYEKLHADDWAGTEIKDGDSLFIRHENEAHNHWKNAKYDKEFSGSWLYLQGSMVPNEGFMVGFPHHILGFSGRNESLASEHWEDFDDVKSTANRWTVRRANDQNTHYLASRAGRKALLKTESEERALAGAAAAASEGDHAGDDVSAHHDSVADTVGAGTEGENATVPQDDLDSVEAAAKAEGGGTPPADENSQSNMWSRAMSSMFGR